MISKEHLHALTHKGSADCCTLIDNVQQGGRYPPSLGYVRPPSLPRGGYLVCVCVVRRQALTTHTQGDRACCRQVCVCVCVVRRRAHHTHTHSGGPGARSTGVCVVNASPQRSCVRTLLLRLCMLSVPNVLDFPLHRQEPGIADSPNTSLSRIST